MSVTSTRKRVKASMTALSNKTHSRHAQNRKSFPMLDRLFLPWQIDWILDDSQVACAEKCRQSGFSTAQSFRSTMLCLNDIKSTYYSTYSLPACKNFIRRAGNAARAFNYIAEYTTGKQIIDEQEITTFKVTFPNGLFVEAIPGDPKQARDRTDAEFVIDEAGFRLAGLREIIKAALANSLWGVGSIRIISTHNGEDNEFNQVCREYEADPTLGKLHRITFRQAVAQGLYKQICAMTGKIWTPEAERDWVNSWYKKYGEGASEELDVIPRKFGSSKYFKPEHFHRVRVSEQDRLYAAKYRAWDLAATDKAKAKSGTFYTANLMALHIDDYLVITDGDAKQLGATEGNQWIADTARHDSRDTVVLLEQEPGSTGIKFVAYMEEMISTRSVLAYKPQTSKNVRAFPLNPALRDRKILFDEEMEKEKFEMIRDAICGFDGKPRPLISDITDCLSMLWAFVSDEFADWLDND